MFAEHPPRTQHWMSLSWAPALHRALDRRIPHLALLYALNLSLPVVPPMVSAAVAQHCFISTRSQKPPASAGRSGIWWTAAMAHRILCQEADLLQDQMQLEHLGHKSAQSLNQQLPCRMASHPRPTCQESSNLRHTTLMLRKPFCIPLLPQISCVTLTCTAVSAQS